MKVFKITINIFFLMLFTTLSYGQDWANLKRFQQENSELMLAKAHENRVVFMGNSITEGWLSIRPEFFKNKPYVNRGISGQTTPQMLVRFRQDVIHLKPSTVVLLAGINDIAENTGPSTIEMIANNIVSMAELAKANHINVIICSVLPANKFPWREGLKPAEKVIKLNTILKSYSKKHKLAYVNYYSAMVNDSHGLKKELGEDGIHPNKNGYLIMEPILEKAIKKYIN
ncbi:SGNH/GDSL hydrolase family protein [Flavobacteriaceae bacterium]|nr:SGNH/GDSL hydrolase family protein [Flavobacteriaceae bacterium]